MTYKELEKLKLQEELKLACDIINLEMDVRHESNGLERIKDDIEDIDIDIKALNKEKEENLKKLKQLEKEIIIKTIPKVLIKAAHISCNVVFFLSTIVMLNTIFPMPLDIKILNYLKEPFIAVLSFGATFIFSKEFKELTVPAIDKVDKNILNIKSEKSISTENENNLTENLKMNFERKDRKIKEAKKLENNISEKRRQLQSIKASLIPDEEVNNEPIAREMMLNKSL